MPVVYITRLRLRSLRFLPQFLFHSWASARQVRSATGFISGVLASENASTYWTITVWADSAATKSYRDSGAHKRAMPKLVHWCDEAATAHFERETPALPSCDMALAQLKVHGRLSKVRYPSSGQHQGEIAVSATVPKIGARLTAV